MLCQFTIKNYKSFKDSATLDMQATDITEHTDEIILDDVDNEKFLPLSVIYGPNGGGKSNVLDALCNLVCRVLKPVCAVCNKKDCGTKVSCLPAIPFKFDNESMKLPTEYELFFRTNAYEYRYILHVKKEKVVFESLDRIKIGGSNVVKIFKRDINATKTIELYNIVNKVETNNITDTLPLLSYFAIINGSMPIIKDIIGFFHEIEMINYGNPFQEAQISIVKDESSKNLIISMLKEMDIDIIDYEIKEREEEKIEFNTMHMINGEKKILKLEEESNGTIKIFGVLPTIAECLLSGGILVADELDAKIHPKLLQYIIGLFRNPKTNKKKSQLIFTSHDLTTMTSEFFRRDEIWFAAKNNQQESKLYSLVEIKKGNGKQPRKDENYAKQYLEGRYGADPYLRCILNWGEV
jgi:AAA15 family ATPase/GTPase